MSEATSTRRRNADYLLPDGSPRYGIRTEEVSEAIQTPGATTPENGVEEILKRASGLNIAHLHAAATYAPLLSEHAGNPLLEKLKEEHEEVLEQAWDCVNKELGHPRNWRSDARSLRNEVELSGNGVPSKREINLAVKGVGFFVVCMFMILVPLLIAFYLLSVGVPGELVLIVYAVLSICARKILKRHSHRVPFLNTPVDVDQVRTLRNAVDDAVFIRLLQTKDIELDAMAVKAGLSQWEHMCFIADKVDQMWAYSRR